MYVCMYVCNKNSDCPCAYINRLHGTGRNPYNVNHYTGGSSGGSAAAVAAGEWNVMLKILILLIVIQLFKCCDSSFSAVMV